LPGENAGRGKPLEQPLERGTEGGNEAARGKDILGGARRGEQRWQLERPDDRNREMQHVAVDELAAAVLVLVEQVAVDARLGDERVDALVDGGYGEGIIHAGRRWPSTLPGRSGGSVRSA